MPLPVRVPQPSLANDVDFILRRLAIQRLAIYSQDRRGRLDVAFRLLEHLNYMTPLHLVQRQTRTRRGEAERRWQVLEHDPRLRVENHRPLDHVLELAHVARPGVRLHAIEPLGRLQAYAW